MQPSALVENPRPTLFSLTKTLTELFDLLEALEDEADKDAAAAEIDRIVSMELSKKVDGIARFDRECDLEVTKLQSFVIDIEKRIGAIHNRKKQIRDMTSRAMHTLGASKLKGDVYTITLRTGGESVHVSEEGIIPQTYFNRKETMTLDKNRVKSDLKSGKDIPGVELKTGTEVLTIR